MPFLKERRSTALKRETEMFNCFLNGRFIASYLQVCHTQRAGSRICCCTGVKCLSTALILACVTLKRSRIVSNLCCGHPDFGEKKKFRIKTVLWIQIHWIRIHYFGPIWIRIQGFIINFEENNKVILERHFFKTIFF